MVVGSGAVVVANFGIVRWDKFFKYCTSISMILFAFDSGTCVLLGASIFR